MTLPGGCGIRGWAESPEVESAFVEEEAGLFFAEEEAGLFFVLKKAIDMQCTLHTAAFTCDCVAVCYMYIPLHFFNML